jgi:hypothetical protein
MPTPATVQDVVVKVCSIPADFHRRGDVSVVYLLEESGYDTIRDAITVPILQQYLQAQPSLIADWAGYSEDKRCSSGWYFDDSRYSIGHFSAEAGQSREQVFAGRKRACAEFIKHELESIRENPSFGSGQKSLGSRRKRMPARFTRS